MNLWDIAWASLLRRKAKFGFVLTGLTVGVATVVALLTLTDSLTGEINSKLEKYGANILISPKTERLSLAYEGVNLGGVSFDLNQLRQSDLNKIKTIKNAANVAAVGPILLGVVHIGQEGVGGRKALLAGIDFNQTRILKPWWKVIGQKPQPGQLLAGAKAAEALKLSAGAKAKVNDRAMTVSGLIAPTGSQDDNLVFVHLADAQAILGKPGMISMAEAAALCTACPIDEMVKQIGAILPGARVTAISQVVKSRMKSMSGLKRMSMAVGSLVVLVGGLVVLVTMTGSVRERTSEIGVFRAIGFRQGQVMRIILTEAGLVALIAGLLGYGLGLTATYLALPFVSESGRAVMSLEPILAGGAVVLSVAISLLAGAYPAHLAGRMEPSQALRTL